MTTVSDAPERARVVNPLQSYCVTAPAGSGKTELLIQRYLCLLARVQRPEQVLAITFTRKAAAEMRERVLEALQAAREGAPCDSDHQRRTRELAVAALNADESNGWELLENVSRLTIKTIDSFCAGLARQMPVLSTVGGQASPVDDPAPLYEEAVVEFFGRLDDEGAIGDELRLLLGHFNNRQDYVQTLLVSMLARRDQWGMYLGFHDAPDSSEDYLVDVVQDLVAGQLLPLYEQLRGCAEEILALQRFSAGNLEAAALEQFPSPGPERLADWRVVADLLLTRQGGLKKRVNKDNGFPADKGGVEEQRKQQMTELLDKLRGLPGVEAMLVAVRLLPEMTRGTVSWQLAVALSRLLPVLQAELLLVFRRRGVVDYPQLAQSALTALGSDAAPTELALRLDYCIEHILVDEFQDTSNNQFELLRKLTRGWVEHNEGNPGAPRTLLVVGDAMQSIYGFRDANVGLFLRVRQEGFNGLAMEQVALSSNFRSEQGIVSWVNDTFGRHFPARDEPTTGKVRYSDAIAARPAGTGVPVTIDAFAGDDAIAAEEAHIARAIAGRVADGERGIAVLGRQRSHLRPLLRQLKALGVSCQAPELDSLNDSPVVADLLVLCRALASDTDRLAWLSLLRAPWCGLRLDDLLRLSQWQAPAEQPLRLVLGDAALLASLSSDGAQRVARLDAVIARAKRQRDRLALRVWVEQAWVGLGGPRCAADVLGLEDAESFLQLLEEADSEGFGLDVDWLERRVERKFMSGGDADSPVQLMTLHKAKGLEFERVFIPRLDGLGRAGGGELLRWDEAVDTAGRPVFVLAANDRSTAGEPTLFQYLGVRQRAKEENEAMRLLYVGATRSIRHLHLSARIRLKNGDPVAPARGSLLAAIWETFADNVRLHDAPAAESRDAPGPPPLVRLASTALPAVKREETDEKAGDNRPERPDNHFERTVGTVVHLALEELSLETPLPAEPRPPQWARWRNALRLQGLAGAELEEAVELVAASVSNTLSATGRGRWILSAEHREARSEWSLNRVDDEGIVRNAVIDRCFVDTQSGDRWIVDYKTSRPADGESLESFTAREAAHYASQLAGYRDMLQLVGPEPIRCALYFTTLGLLHELDGLALPASGGLE